MKKFGMVFAIVCVVAVSYLILTVIMPFLTETASTANTTAFATSNVSDYPGASEGLIVAPWLLYFAPAVIGIVAIIITLKAK